MMKVDIDKRKSDMRAMIEKWSSVNKKDNLNIDCFNL